MCVHGQHKSVVFKLWHTDGLLKCRLLGPTLRVSDSLGLCGDLRICFSNNFPNADAIRRPHFENQCGKEKHRKMSTGIIHHDVNSSYFWVAGLERLYFFFYTFLYFFLPMTAIVIIRRNSIKGFFCSF